MTVQAEGVRVADCIFRNGLRPPPPSPSPTPGEQGHGMTDKLPSIHLKSKAHTRLTRGHLWVYSNEVDHIDGEVEPGSEVCIVDAAGKPRGTGLHNPHTLISIRLHSRRGERLDAALIDERVGAAIAMRRQMYPDRQCWRGVFSEADGLPGLIVDRIGEVAVVQILTAGMERRRDEVVAAIEKHLQPTAIIERSDSPQRSLEGLEARAGLLKGECDDTLVVEDPVGVKIEVPLAGGQKTGLYLDHHDNRVRLQGKVRGLRVLDVFCYIGQWSLCAAAWGAESVTAIDSSADALRHAERGAELNGVADKCAFVQGDCFDWLKELEKEKEHFDVIVLDPPAFAKSKRQAQAALRGYKDLNFRAMRLLRPGGLLMTASCSHHVDESAFREMLVQASRNANCEFVFEAPLRQSADHPVLLGHPETLYLKGAMLRRVR